jgi:hypothetical protein
MSVLRPAWITKEEFYRTPFNFCHRWCERCQLTHLCKVYREGERDRKRALKEGKDPNSWEFTFGVMQKNLRKTFTMIARDAKRMGIPLKELNKYDEAENQKYEKEQEQLRRHPLKKQTDRWSDHIRVFLKKFTEVPIETPIAVVIEAQEVLSWYQPLVPAKVCRALDSDRREKEYPEDWRSYDERTSAFIAYNGLIEVSNVLMRLAAKKSLRDIKHTCLFLSMESLELAQILSQTFYFDTRKES